MTAWPDSKVDMFLSAFKSMFFTLIGAAGLDHPSFGDLCRQMNIQALSPPMLIQAFFVSMSSPFHHLC